MRSRARGGARRRHAARVGGVVRGVRRACLQPEHCFTWSLSVENGNEKAEGLIAVYFPRAVQGRARGGARRNGEEHIYNGA